MTDKKNLKRRIRARMNKTGERYARARQHVLGKDGEATRPASETHVRVSGRVLDPTGTPVSNAKVRWSGFRAEYFRSCATDSPARTDANGRYAFEIVRSPKLDWIELVATHEVWAWDHRRIDLTPAADGDYSQDLSLEVPARLSGRLISNEGAFAAAVVEVVPASQEQPRPKLPILSDPWEGRRATAKVLSDGSFLVTHLRPGEVDVLAIAHGYQPSIARGIEVRPDTPGFVELVATPGLAIRGRFVDSSGSPLDTSVRITYRAIGSDADHRETGVSGELFAVEGLAEGRYELFFRTPPYLGYGPEARIEAVAGTQDLVVEVLRSASLAGTLVTPEEGPPLGEVRYLALTRRGGSGTGLAVGPDGSFRLENLSPEVTRIEIEAEGYLSHTLLNPSLREGETLDLTIDLQADPGWVAPAPQTPALDDPAVALDHLRAADTPRARELIKRVRDAASRNGGHPPQRRSTRPDLLPVLEFALEHSDEEVRTQAICTLAYMNHPEAFAPLKNALGHADSGVRYYAVMGLGWLMCEPSLHDEVVQLHRSVTDDPKHTMSTRVSAAENLVTAGLETDPQIFFAALKDPDANAALASAALATLGRKDGVELMIDRLRSETRASHHVSLDLEKLTGVNLGTGFLEWKTWLEANRGSLPQQVS